ncbi:DsrE family protein [Celeribacter ethanolicus]|uniref:Sulfur reduction protein DsrE n=1 Tax=Celeribacter ethanolicus TaxID=1758178 RepID=A0A291G907_9RHOB|nr:DsrE family protein [Celeribacter ethanolicus]ATG46637.1 sulfur reduction protein DsrE [Celeribacter ethanolicus]TNE66369.1 MAG: sulfur reduction protein DsrE [Paracoccaceae bacterium]
MQTADFVATIFDGHSNPGKVTVAFTMALNAQKMGHSSIVLLMVEGVELGKPGSTEGMDIGKPFEPVANLVKEYRAAGGRIGICGACMIHNGFSAEEMDPDYEIITAPEVVELMMAAKGTMPIT